MIRDLITGSKTHHVCVQVEQKVQSKTQLDSVGVLHGKLCRTQLVRVSPRKTGISQRMADLFQVNQSRGPSSERGNKILRK